jgi:tetrapyrrole methylase family protein/MazG family protein
MSKSFDKLVEIVRTLRSPEGCPWDREQNLYSIKEQFIEEAYELLDALDNKDIPNIKEEVGDVLFHMVFHSVMAEDEGKFTLDDAINEVTEKLIRRHPHVFGTETVSDSADVVVNWDKIKAEEKKHERRSFFDGVPISFPPIRRAKKIQEKARKTGFDWANTDDCMAKVREEFAEFESAIKEGNKKEIEHELGDVFFSLINVSRFLKVDPDEALRECNKRFETRFSYIGDKLAERGLKYEDVSLDEMESLWIEAKTQERNSQ